MEDKQMNASAKPTTISFLAAAALGAAVFMGCTVTSGTVDDTDGGTQNNNNNNNNKDGGTQSETGTGAETGTSTCEPTTKQTSKFPPEACQTCLEKSCCLELNNCFSLPGDEAGGKVDCNGFKDCLDDCAKKPADEQDACNAECSDTLAAAGVVDAYKSIFACAEQSCAAECVE